MISVAFHTVADVAARLAVKTDVVLNWIDNGDLPAINVAANRRPPRRRIDPEQFEQFTARRAAIPQRAKNVRQCRKPSGVIEFF